MKKMKASFSSFWNKKEGQKGVAIIEFAFVLPILLILVFAIIDFGYGFVIYEAGGRVVSNVSALITATPAASQSTITQASVNNIGAPLMTFNDGSGNTLCAQSYATLDQAKLLSCSGGTWVTTQPPSTSGTYYVAIKAVYTPKVLAKDPWNYLSTIKFVQTAVATVGGSSTSIIRTVITKISQ